MHRQPIHYLLIVSNSHQPRARCRPNHFTDPHHITSRRQQTTCANCRRIIFKGAAVHYVEATDPDYRPICGRSFMANERGSHVPRAVTCAPCQAAFLQRHPNAHIPSRWNMAEHYRTLLHETTRLEAAEHRRTHPCTDKPDASSTVSAQQDAEMEAAMQDAVKRINASAPLVARIKKGIVLSGTDPCPACSDGEVHWSKSSWNGHVAMRCSTPDCINFME